MISYDDLYEALRKEKYSDNLQSLQKRFLQDAAKYFEEKKEFLNREEDMFSDVAIKNKKKLDNAMSSFKTLLRLRKKKILNLAFVASEVGIGKKDFENLLGFEKELFEELVKSLERAEKDLQEEMSGGEEIEGSHVLVRFLVEVPEFLDFGGNEIGPFDKGEVANLEKEVIDILKKDGKVEVIEED